MKEAVNELEAGVDLDLKTTPRERFADAKKPQHPKILGLDSAWCSDRLLYSLLRS